MKRRVLKRDGSTVKFDRTKLLNSIVMAYKEAHPDASESIAMDIARFVYSSGIQPWIIAQRENKIKTNELRDVIENALMMLQPNTARAYITYKYRIEIENYKKEKR